MKKEGVVLNMTGNLGYMLQSVSSLIAYRRSLTEGLDD